MLSSAYLSLLGRCFANHCWSPEENVCSITESHRRYCLPTKAVSALLWDHLGDFLQTDLSPGSKARNNPSAVGRGDLALLLAPVRLFGVHMAEHVRNRQYVWRSFTLMRNFRYTVLCAFQNTKPVSHMLSAPPSNNEYDHDTCCMSCY